VVGSDRGQIQDLVDQVGDEPSEVVLGKSAVQ